MPPRSSRRFAVRSGFSLTEVLVSTFVAVIGLVSLAAVLPVGIAQLTSATRLDAASSVGRNAWRDVERGALTQFKRTDLAPGQAGSPYQYQSLYYTPSGTTFTPVQLTDGLLLGSYVIDPYGLSNLSNANSDMAGFPSQYGGVDQAQRLPRWTIRRSAPWTIQNASGVQYKMPLPLGYVGSSEPLDQIGASVRSMFSSRLDGVYADEIDPDSGRRDREFYRLSTSGDQPTTNGIELYQSQGRYSWLITVTPSLSNRIDPITGIPDDDSEATVSVAVCYGRPVPPLNDVFLKTEERRFTVAFVNNAFFGNAIVPSVQGGDAVIGWTSGANESAQDSAPELNSGDWVLLYTRRQIADHPQWADHPAFASAGDNQKWVWQSKWYRIESLGELRSSGTSHYRTARLLGPDWDLSPVFKDGSTPAGPSEPLAYLNDAFPGLNAQATTHYTAWGAVPGRVVAVMEKTMRLQPEGSRLGVGF
jgi:type II secretory pathway pseudopilin PulG